MPYKVRIPDLLWYRTNILCMEACPVHTDSGIYVQLIGQGEDQEAYFVARSSNPFASVCGRLCAAPCEDACRRGKIMIDFLKQTGFHELYSFQRFCYRFFYYRKD